MIRNDVKYEQKRTNHLMKLKDVHEKEFIVVGYKEGTGRDSNTVIWECEIP